MILHFPHHRHTTGAPMQGVPDFQQNAGAISIPLPVPETQFFDANGIQKRFALRIIFLLLGQTVLKPVKLHVELCGRAIEIQIIFSNMVLAAKFEAGEPTGFQR